MSADWTTCRVARDRDGDLWGRLGDDWVSLLPGATDSFPSDWLMSALGPLVPVLDADGLPVVTTVGDLTARHIGRRVRWGDDGGGVLEFDEGVLEFVGAGRCRFECLLDLDGRESPRTFGQWLPLDAPCELLP